MDTGVNNLDHMGRCMTPDEVSTLARQRYNAVGDAFFSDDELYTLQWAGQMELAVETLCIRKVFSTTTVVGQQEYAKPSTCISIKSVTYDGMKLIKITDRQDNELTLNNSMTTVQGTPQYYWEWGDNIELRSLPDDTKTLKIYCFSRPQTVSAITTLDVPVQYHPAIADYLIAKMAGKDKNFEAAQYYGGMWAQAKSDAKRQERKNIRGDAFSRVMTEEEMPTINGNV